MLDHKISLNKFKRIEIISSSFSNHNGMKLELNHKKPGKNTIMGRLNNRLRKNRWVNEEIQSFFKKKEKFQVNNLTSQPKELGKEEQMKPRLAEGRK